MKKLVWLMIMLQAGEAAGELKYIPEWHMCGDQACYAFADAKTLVLLDEQLKLCVDRDAALSTAVAELQESNRQYKLTVDLANKQYADEQKFSGELASKLKKSEAERVALADRATWGWVAAGGVALIAVGVGVGVWAARR